MTSFNRILALGTTLTSLALCAGNSFGAQITATQETTAISNLKPVYAYGASDTFRLTGVSDTLSDMDGMSLGAATAVAATSSYWYMDGSNNLSTMATASSIWRTFTVGSVPASWSASGTIVLPGSIENGATQGSPTQVLTITLTKTGTPVDLTQTQLASVLSSSVINGITATTALTAISLGTAPTGWAIKAYMSTGTAQTLDPLSMTAQWAATPTTGSAMNFTTALTNLHTWNPSSGIPTAESLTFTLNGRSFSIGSLNPSTFAKTAGIGAGVLTTLTAGLGGGTIKKINVANVSFMDDIPTAITSVRGKLKASPGTTSANELINLVADAAFKKATFVVGGFTTTADTNKYGLASFTSANITSVTWDTLNGTTLRATGVIGSAPAKAFTCDLSGIKVVKAGTNEVLRFTSPDGDSFWLKAFDATGLDTSAVATVPASSQDALLVLELLNKLSAVTPITKLTMDGIIAAC